MTAAWRTTRSVSASLPTIVVLHSASAAGSSLPSDSSAVTRTSRSASSSAFRIAAACCAKSSGLNLPSASSADTRARQNGSASCPMSVASAELDIGLSTRGAEGGGEEGNGCCSRRRGIEHITTVHHHSGRAKMTARGTHGTKITSLTGVRCSEIIDFPARQRLARRVVWCRVCSGESRNCAGRQKGGGASSDANQTARGATRKHRVSLPHSLSQCSWSQCNLSRYSLSPCLRMRNEQRTSRRGAGAAASR